MQVWWSPCPSRECPEEEELDIVVDQCIDHCLLDQNPKIEAIPPTKTPLLIIASTTVDNGDIDDLNFHVSKKRPKNKTDVLSSFSSTTSTTEAYIESGHK